jgi:hypothetical protein
MRDEVFGESNEPENEQPARMVLPARAQNYIEIELRGQLASAQAVVPSPPFLDGDSGEFENEAEYGGISPRTALDVRNLLLGDHQEKFRRQIALARDLGPTRNDGGPWSSEYELACLIEGIEPWPAGDRLVHEPSPPRMEQTR